MAPVKLQCVVCRSVTASVSELHHHYMFSHSTEDLSLAVVSLQGLINVMDPAPGRGIVDRMFQESLNKFPQFYMLCRNPSGDTGYSTDSNSGEVSHCPMILGNIVASSGQAGPSRVTIQKMDGLGKGIMGSEQKINRMFSESGLHRVRKNLDFPDISSPSSKDLSVLEWGSETMKLTEISDESFLRSVDGICNHFSKIKGKFLKGKSKGKWNESQRKEVCKTNWRKRNSPENANNKRSLVITPLPLDMPMLTPFYVEKRINVPPENSLSAPEISPYNHIRISTDTLSHANVHNFCTIEDLNPVQTDLTLKNNSESIDKIAV